MGQEEWEELALELWVLVQLFHTLEGEEREAALYQLHELTHRINEVNRHLLAYVAQSRQLVRSR